MSDVPFSCRSLKLVQLCALIITTCTGFTGLVYEVTWQRYLSNLFGSQAQATALILAVFLGGLSGGYLCFGRFSRGKGRKSLVGACGIVEVAIGVWALAFPLLFQALWSVYVRESFESLQFAVDLLSAIVLIGMPTLLMGGTLPLLTQGLAADLRESAQFHARLYALNTAGACLGCLAGGFYFLPEYGLPLTVLGMGGVNVLSGLALYAVSRSLTDESDATSVAVLESSDPVAASGDHLSLSLAALIAALSGCAAIALQTVMIRVVGINVGSSDYAFSMVVSAFILMLALGAWRRGAGGSAPGALTRNFLRIAFGWALLYMLVPLWPYGAHLVRLVFSDEVPSFYVYHFALFILLCLLLFIPVGAMGNTLPLLFESTRDRFAAMGKVVGVVYGWNTFGCVLGATLGGYLGLYIFDLDQLLRVALMLVVICCIIVARRTGTARVFESSPAFVLTCAAILAFIVFIPSWPRIVLAKGTFRQSRALEFSYGGYRSFYRHFAHGVSVLAYKDDPNTSVAVTEMFEHGSSEGPSRSIWVNGKADGSTKGTDLYTTRLLAHIPALLQSSVSGSAAVIGFGTGITVGSLSLYPEFKSIEVIEISPFVRRFARYFDFANHGVSTNPRVAWRLNDAYRALIGSKERYAVVISEPSNPWVAGVEKLYSNEFYEIVKGRLAEGGLYAQWFHTYSLSIDTLRLVVSTFSASFPHVRLFNNGRDIILIGSLKALDGRALEQLGRRFEIPEVKSELNDLQITRPSALLAYEMWLPKEALLDGGMHSLDFPRLAYAAGKDFFGNRMIDLAHLGDDPQMLRWSVAQSGKTLYELWNVTTPTRDLGALVSDYCRTPQSGLFDNWEESHSPCRRLLVHAIMHDRLPMLSTSWEPLKRLYRVDAELSFASVSDAERALALYARNASVYSLLPKARIDEAGKFCEKDSKRDKACQSAYEQALVVSGYSSPPELRT